MLRLSPTHILVINSPRVKSSWISASQTLTCTWISREFIKTQILILHFSQASQWYQCCWSVGHTLSSKAEDTSEITWYIKAKRIIHSDWTSPSCVTHCLGLCELRDWSLGNSVSLTHSLLKADLLSFHRSSSLASSGSLGPGLELNAVDSGEESSS